MIGKAFLENLAESANPVFIKEMRQYFQNRRMVFFMGALLLVQFICTLFFTSAADYSGDGSAGVTFFLLIVFAGAILSILICSLGAEQRFAEERSDKELNYAMLTTLKPASIILGKLEGALVMILCIFSMLLPFLTAAYFMRGLSAAALLIVLYMIPVLLLATLAGILAGAFGKRWINVLYIIALINAGIGLVPVGFALAEELMDGVALDSKFWIALAIEYILSFLAGVLVFLLSVAVIAPPKSNRLFATKIYLFLLPFLTFAVLTCWHLLDKSSLPLEAMLALEYMFFSGTIGVLLLIALFEPATSGIRIYMKVPRDFFGRFFHFLFSTGFPGSLLLAILISLLPATMLILPPSPSIPYSFRPFTCAFLCILFTSLGNVILALVISWRTKLKVPPWLWIVIFQLAGNVAVWVTVVANEDFEDLPDLVRAFFMLLSPFYALVEGFEANGRAPYEIPFWGMAGAFAVTAILFLLILPVILKAFKLHRRPADADAIKTPTPEMMKK